MTDTKEQLFTLADGRTLAYSATGNFSSSTIVLYVHGNFTVGDASGVSKVILQKNVHYIAPTLPGWGNSSSIPSGANYASTLVADITSLLNHLHPDDTALKLYIAGGSSGTVPAQILYGAPFDVFPLGKYLKGLLLLGAITPFRYHKEYTKSLTMSNYIMVGPPSLYIPFNLLPRLIGFALARKFKTTESAESFLRSTIFDRIGDEERVAYARWRGENGEEEADLVRRMAEHMVRSVAKTWEGLVGSTKVLHSDWGFRPDTLDEEHAKRPILIVTGTTDDMTPISMAEWLVANYKNARLKPVVGGHLAPLFYREEIFREFLEEVE